MKDKIKIQLSSFWALIRNVGFMFVILLLAYIVFTVPDQSDDFISSFIAFQEPVYYFIVALLLLCWSYITWYSSSIILDITPIDPINIQNLNTEKFNRFMAFFPFGILALTFFQAASEVKNSFVAIIIGISFILLGISMMYFLKILDRRNFEVQDRKWPGLVDIIKHQYRREKGKRIPPTFKQEIDFIKQFRNVLFYFREIGLIAIALLILFCIPDILIPLSQFLKPASVIILSFCFITYLVTVLFYFHDVEVRPFVLIIVLCLFVFSYWNDNTTIPIAKEIPDNRLTPTAAFEKWYLVKSKDWNDTINSMPVVFIATQGGGIRGELWTIECLNKLSKEIPGFQNQIFCIGGASGGTVGAVYSVAFGFDTLLNKKENDKLTYENLLNFAGTDCISPVTASFAFGENLQHLLPMPVPFLDRSKIMMRAFSKAYKNELNSSIVDSGLLNLYYPQYKSENFETRIPSLLISGVLAETGQRVITSNLKTSGSKNFDNDIDFFDYTQIDISFATASLNCMRFPMLLSGGLFYKKIDQKCYRIGHIVDGGYRENTGLQAMYSLMCDLYPQMNEHHVIPILLYFRNGNKEIKDTMSKAIRFMHDVGTPITALLNVNGTSVPALGIMKMIEQQKKVGNPMNMITGDLWLNNDSFKSEATFPLGLYMSENAKDALHERADLILSIDTSLINDLHRRFKK